MEINFWLESAYSFVMVFCSVFIYFRTRKIYTLTRHGGIQSFRNAFLFMSIAFIARYLSLLLQHLGVEFGILASIGIWTIFTYSLSVAGFYLVYSLVWKNYGPKRVYLLHLVALLAAIIDIFVPPAVFAVQAAVFLYAVSVSYSNYQIARKGHKNQFQQFYFIALVLAFISYLIAVLSYYIPSLEAYFKIVTIGVLFIFLYGVVIVIKWPRKESA